MNENLELEFVRKCLKILLRCQQLERMINKCEKNKDFKQMAVYHRAQNRYIKLYNTIKQKEILNIKKRTNK